MSNPPRINSVLFDLDGTLADTSPDMADALNILFKKIGKPSVDYELARKNTSRGSIALIQLGFEHPLEDPLRKQLQKQYLQIYAENLCNKTTLFPGVDELLNSLDENKTPWGIVTNKPANLAEPLLKELKIAERCGCLVSGDTLPKRKPHPDPLHHAAKILNIKEQDTIYIGDDPRDIQAGKAAGMATAVASYGYIQDNENPRNWGADILFSQPMELKDWLFPNS